MGAVELDDSSSVTGNTATGSGGGIYNNGSYTLPGTVTLNDNSTVTGNTASFNGGISNGTYGTVTLNGSSSAVCGNTPDDWPGCTS